jgi:hypothetical protein
MKLWSLIRASTNIQIIVASHSPLALRVPRANYIEFSEGYLKECEHIFEKVNFEDLAHIKRPEANTGGKRPEPPKTPKPKNPPPPQKKARSHAKV